MLRILNTMARTFPVKYYSTTWNMSQSWLFSPPCISLNRKYCNIYEKSAHWKHFLQLSLEIGQSVRHEQCKQLAKCVRMHCNVRSCQNRIVYIRLKFHFASATKQKMDFVFKSYFICRSSSHINANLLVETMLWII